MIKLALPAGRVELVHPSPPEDDIHVQELYLHPRSVEHLPFLTSDLFEMEGIIKRRETRLVDPRYRDFRIHFRDGSDAQSSPKLVGIVGLLNIDEENQSAEAGVMIHPNLHRSGYATEALYLLLDYAFTQMNIHRVVMTTSTANMAMRGWLEKVLGAKHEGVLREAWKHLKSGIFIDAALYSILTAEWTGPEGTGVRLRAKLQAILETESGNIEVN